MVNTHVFIVDKNTFKYHLEYMFAGTGAKDYVIDFNNSEDSKLYHSNENILLGMIADLNRVRIGDNIIFYLQQNDQVPEGKFYGIFKVKSLGFLDNFHHFKKKISLSKNYTFKYPKSDWRFEINKNNLYIKSPLSEKQEINLLKRFEEMDKNKIEKFIKDFYNNNQYLLKNLQKSLTFRILIEPSKVYSKGVTEWEALDEIKEIENPFELQWSLIYRKLRAKRGNTMITISEAERLFKLLKNQNQNNSLEGENFSFNLNSEEIISSSTDKIYTGRQEEINILPRLIKKYKSKLAFEAHLQAYILQNIDSEDFDVCNILFENLKIEWIGNEVSCGVGMQRIDIMISVINNVDKKTVFPVELKAVEAEECNLKQIQRYINWIKQYYIPNRESKIQPVLITKEIIAKNSTKYNSLIGKIKDFNENNSNIFDLIFIEYKLENDNLKFNKVDY